MKRLLFLLFLIGCVFLGAKKVSAYDCCTSDGYCINKYGTGATCNNCGNMSCACSAGKVCNVPNVVVQPTLTCASYGQQCSSNDRCCSGVCYANTCVYSTGPVAPGQPTPTTAPAQQSSCNWYTNADQCFSSHCSYDGGNTNGSGDGCCACPPSSCPGCPSTSSFYYTDTYVYNLTDPNDYQAGWACPNFPGGWLSGCGGGDCCHYGDCSPGHYCSDTSHYDCRSHVDGSGHVYLGCGSGQATSWLGGSWRSYGLSCVSYQVIPYYNTSGNPPKTCPDPGYTPTYEQAGVLWVKVWVAKCVANGGAAPGAPSNLFPAGHLDRVPGASTKFTWTDSGDKLTAWHDLIVTDQNNKSKWTAAMNSAVRYTAGGQPYFPDTIGKNCSQKTTDGMYCQVPFDQVCHDINAIGDYCIRDLALDAPQGFYPGHDFGDSQYQWTIQAKTACKEPGGVAGVNFNYGVPPVFNVLNIRNVNGTTFAATSGTLLEGDLVNAENIAGVGTSVNQICQTDFKNQTGHSRDVSYRVNIHDDDGIPSVSRIGFRMTGSAGTLTLWMNNVGAGTTSPGALSLTVDSSSTASLSSRISWYGNNSPPIINYSASANNVTAVFPIRFASDFPTGIYSLSVYTIDNAGLLLSGSTGGWLDTNRDFKVWNCNVPVTGRVYNASAYSQSLIQSCNSSVYTTTVSVGDSFQSLAFNPGPLTMAVASPNYSGNLGWGTTYVSVFNSNLRITSPELGMRIIDVNRSPSLTTCGVSTNYRVNLGSTLSSGNYVINPYQTNPTAQIDFAGIQRVTGWYQVKSAGVQANGILQNQLPWPSLCNSSSGCVPATSISGVGVTNNGFVAGGGGLRSISGCGTDQGCLYSSPINWYSTTGTVVGKMNYEDLLNLVFYRNGVGVTGASSSALWSNFSANINTTGSQKVLLANGDLTISSNNLIRTGVGTSGYAVVIVKGNLTIDPSITRLDSLVIATGNISIGGTNTSPLVINGSMHAGGDITISRTFSNLSNDNTAAPVQVNFAPELLFTVPQKLLFDLSKWKLGG